MKRNPALQPLSRDHHNVLVHARRLRGLDPRIDAATAARRFRSYHDAVLRHHFDEEESLLAPHLDDGLRKRLADEHADLTGRAAALPKDAVDLGERLRLHVRFEEDVVFPHLEARLGEPALVQLARQLEDGRRRVRPASLEPGAEACFL